MEGTRGYGTSERTGHTKGYNRPDTYQGQARGTDMGRDYDVDRERGITTGTTVGAGAGGGMLAKAKEMLVDRPVEAVKVRKDT